MATPGLSAAGSGDEVRRLWTGSWVVVKTEFYSNCTEAYTNTEVSGGHARQAHRGFGSRLMALAAAANPEIDVPVVERPERRFGPGELGRVQKVQVKSARVDLLIDVSGPALLAREHGPFTLYDPVSCRVELQVEVPKKAFKEGRAAVEQHLAQAAERFDREGVARASRSFNGREIDPYPGGYEQTLWDYVAWWDREVEDGMAEAKSALERLGPRLEDSRYYIAGLLEGIAQMATRFGEPPCERIVGATIGAFAGTRPSGLTDDGETLEFRSTDREGFADGQELAFAALMLGALPGCREDGGASARLARFEERGR